jgi:hypothetical protein
MVGLFIDRMGVYYYIGQVILLAWLELVYSIPIEGPIISVSFKVKSQVPCHAMLLGHMVETHKKIQNKHCE